jgi:deoxycytidine triphosphate deaminase
MKFCSGEEIAKVADKLISEKHQVHRGSMDLTVGKVSAVKKEGDLDFGGSEEKAALTEELKPSKRSPEDEYGWWALTAGEYIIKFNEKIVIPEDCLAILQPLLRTMKAGVIHPVLVFMGGETVEEVILFVGKSGLNIKENARISALIGIKGLSE